MFDSRTRESYLDAATRIVACLALVACSEDEPERTIPVLDAEYAGCAAVYAGPVCTLSTDDRELVFWAEVPRGTAFRVRAGEETLAAAQEYIEGGVQVRATIPENATEVVLERMENNEVASAFKLAIRPDDTPPEITEALALRGQGKFDEAEARIRPLLESEDELVKTRARSTLARIELSRGNHERATELFAETAETFHRLGAVSLSVNDSLPLASILARVQWKLSDAREATRRATARAATLSEGRARAPYYAAQVDSLLGDLRQATVHLRDAEQRAARLGMIGDQALAVQLHAQILQALGRSDEAEAQLASVASSVDLLPSCERADFHTNVGWHRLLRLETERLTVERDRAMRLPDARPPLEAALLVYEADCRSVAAIANVRVNLALASLQLNDPGAAAEHLTRAREGIHADATVSAWALLLDARILAARGDSEAALRRYEELITRSARASAWNELWHARLERAQILEALDRRMAAIEELRQAEQVLDHLVVRVAVGDGRDTFTGGHDASARWLVDLLIREGRNADALEVARAARTRALRSMHRTAELSHLRPDRAQQWSEAVGRYWRERSEQAAQATSAWTDPLNTLGAESDALDSTAERVQARLDEALGLLAGAATAPSARASAPGEALGLLAGAATAPSARASAPGEVSLLYFPGVSGWIAFGVSDSIVEARRIDRVRPDGDPNQLAAQLLLPFERMIEAAERVHIVTYGSLDAVEFANLPWRSGTLLSAKPVTYGVDVSPRIDARPASGIALVVGDPRGDLASANREASAVADVLRARGFELTELRGAAATTRSFVEGLERAAILHYAGHARRAGRGNWESTLPLAGDDELALGDILLLARVADEIVLAACEAGESSDEETGVAGMSLARAFVAAGASFVVAASGLVDDDAAARFSIAYHSARAAGLFPPAAFRSAMLAVADAQSAPPYRLYVP